MLEWTWSFVPLSCPPDGVFSPSGWANLHLQNHYYQGTIALDNQSNAHLSLPHKHWVTHLSPLVQTFLRKSLHTLKSPFVPARPFTSPFPPPSSAILTLNLLTLKVQKCCLSYHFSPYFFFLHCFTLSYAQSSLACHRVQTFISHF